MTLSAEEQIVVNAGTDIFQKYQLEKDSSYDVTFTAYRNGLEQQKTIVSKITATEENGKLAAQRCQYRWNELQLVFDRFPRPKRENGKGLTLPP